MEATNKPSRMRVCFTDGMHFDINVKVTGRMITRRPTSKRVVKDHESFHLAENHTLHLLSGAGSGFMVCVHTNKQAYINLQHDGWYALTLETNRWVQIKAVKMFCGYRAAGKKKPQWVQYNVTNVSASAPIPVEPQGVAKGYKPPEPATDRVRLNAYHQQHKNNTASKASTESGVSVEAAKLLLIMRESHDES